MYRFWRVLACVVFALAVAVLIFSVSILSVEMSLSVGDRAGLSYNMDIGGRVFTISYGVFSGIFFTVTSGVLLIFSSATLVIAIKSGAQVIDTAKQTILFKNGFYKRYGIQLLHSCGLSKSLSEALARRISGFLSKSGGYVMLEILNEPPVGEQLQFNEGCGIVYADGGRTWKVVEKKY